MLTFPEVLADSAAKGIAWSSDITISMAGIQFTPLVPGCTHACVYVANVVWTGAGSTRTCGSLILPAADTAQPTPTTLPVDLFTPVANGQGGYSPPPFAGVVDVSYRYTARVLPSLVNPFVIKRSVFISPRYTSQIKYSVISGDDAFGKECPGF